MENLADNYKHINGWGIDADPENEPTYPMKNWTGDDHRRLDYERSQQQPIDVEVLHSNERPNVTTVFGTSTPPSGISGNLRRKAFEFSESNWNHWLLLLAADRVNVVEGIVDDLKNGHVPNIFAEKGWKAEWKHNPVGLVKKVAITVAVTATIFSLLSGKKEKTENA
ncbi:MAG: hypothetical protein JWP69_207 [Flaviaesturariibacter sp.]|nr:hypothetical protein [Flaviaesturariibacter sp.]